MATAIPRSAESRRYVLRSDRDLPPEQQSTFVYRPLTQLERADVRDGLIRRHVAPDGVAAISQRDRRLSVELCASHLTAVENFPAGAATPWPDTLEERYRYLEQLDDEYVREIGNDIWLRSEVGEEVKNS